MCLGSAKSTSRYDDEHVIGPRPARRKTRASERPIPQHGIDHNTSLRKSKPRPKYIYSPNGGIEGEARTGALSVASSVPHYNDKHVIDAGRRLNGERDLYVYGSRGHTIGRFEDNEPVSSGPSNQATLKASLLAADLTMKQNDKRYLIRRDEKLRDYTEFSKNKEIEVQCANSTSRYDEEHVIGSSSSGWGRSKHVTKDSNVGFMACADTALKGDVYRVMQAEPQHKTRMDDGTQTHGIAKSISDYDEEHVIGAGSSGRGKGKARAKKHVTEHKGSADSTSKHGDERNVSSKTVEGAGSAALTVLAMSSGESVYGGRADERRIGEKLDGRRYGPGSYLSSKTSLKPKREVENKNTNRRPKEYGF